ncbi:MAG TPA: 3-dehydroquinate synthase family protein, partial [Anaeromyxobacteraceae bacterium]|nr:3-dehydroquinate synthase family protein [Anaeromyxobacteraceae bacterium]
RQGEHRYEVRIGPDALQPLASLAGGHDSVAVISAARVLRTPVARRALTALSRSRPVALVHALPDGERGKTLREVERAAAALLRAGGTRRSLVVAIGGGAVTDAAGFVAATFMRGIGWVAIPTTLLAMVDAAIGGKTGVNLPTMKNAVGAFHPPRAVLADPAALDTLPPRELRSGLGEVLKYGALEPGLLGRVTGLGGRAPGAELLAACARAKVEIVARDPLERGERKLLNLGHTFGHGVEAAGGFERFTHGEAVAIGTAFAFRLAALLGRIGPLAVAEMEEAIAGMGLPVRLEPAEARRASALMATDKKRTAAGLRWVLPRAAGGAWTVEWDVPAGADAVAEAVRQVSASTPARARRRGGMMRYRQRSRGGAR